VQAPSRRSNDIPQRPVIFHPGVVDTVGGVAGGDAALKAGWFKIKSRFYQPDIWNPYLRLRFTPRTWLIFAVFGIDNLGSLRETPLVSATYFVGLKQTTGSGLTSG
jgi:hypothetical protein